jgi:hypothetical protein
LRAGQACRTRKQERWGEQQRHRHRAHHRSKCLCLRMLCSCSVPLGLEGGLCTRQQARHLGPKIYGSSPPKGLSCCQIQEKGLSFDPSTIWVACHKAGRSSAGCWK